jgi:hypothetical protein
MSVNNINFAGLGDQRLVESINREWLLSLADRQPLQTHPALISVGSAGMNASLTIKTSEISWNGADQLTAIAEGASVPNTALTDNSHTVTVARHAKAYSPTDLARMTDIQGVLMPASFAMDALMSAAMTLTNLIVALASGFSQSVGSTGVNATVQNFFDARALHDINNVQGQLLLAWHARQHNDFLDSLRAETGALEFQQATADMIAVRGTGFKGNYLDVDFFVSNQAATANSGADRAGMMIGRGAVLWADGTHAPDPAVIGADLLGGRVRLEFDRDGRAAETAAITNRILGVSEGIDLAGVGVITDA